MSYISISPPSLWHLTSIQVHKFHLSSTQAPSQAHPGLKMYVSPPSRSAKLHLRFKQPPSQTHPGFKICFNSMQVLTHLIPDSNILASLPSMYHLTSIRVTRFTCQFHPGANTCVSPPSRSRLSSINLWRSVDQFHPGAISLPSRSNLSSIQALSQTQPGFKICISSASSFCPTLIKVRRILYHPHPCTISLSSRSIDYHFTSIQVVSEFHPGHPDYRLTSIQVVSHLNPGLTSIEVTSYLHPDPENCISSPPRSHLKPTPVLILTPSMLCLTYIDVQGRLVSPTSMYQLAISHVQRLLSI